MKDLNPLDILNSRFLKIIPVHFKKVKISQFDGSENNILKWIEDKLKGRYGISNEPFIDQNNKLKNGFFIGFEDQKESTFFLLACPYIRR